MPTKRVKLPPPTDEELRKYFLKCTLWRHPVSGVLFLRHDRLIFENRQPFNIKYLIGEDGETFTDISDLV
jgi:hypothetical protein